MNKNNLNKKLNQGDIIPDIQLCPFGEVPATSVGGIEIMQVFDEEGLTDVLKESKLPVRCDLDHKSEITNDTESAGWIESLRVDPERGLAGDIKLTKLGADVLNDESYKYGSPAFDINPETGKPIRITSFAFTNRPRIRAIEKIWNMDTPAPVNNIKGNILTMNEDEDDKKAKELIDEIDPKEGLKDNEKIEEVDKLEEVPEESKETEDKPEEKTEEDPEDEKKEEVENEEPSFLDNLKDVIGLPAEATEEDVLATIAEWKKLIEGQKADEIAEEAEEIVNAMNIKDESNKNVILNFYKKDPDTAKTVLNIFKSLPTKSLLNSDVSKPVLNTDEELRKEYAKIPGGKQRVEFLIKHRGSKFI